MHFTLLFTLPLPTLFASPLLITSLQNPLSTQSANVPVIPAWPASYKFQQTLKGIARQTTLYTYPHWKTSVHAFGERAGAVQTFTQDTDGRRTFTTYIWVKGEGCKMILEGPTNRTVSPDIEQHNQAKFIESKKGINHWKSDIADEFWKNDQLVEYWIKPEKETYKGTHITLTEATFPALSFNLPAHWNCPVKPQNNETTASNVHGAADVDGVIYETIDRIHERLSSALTVAAKHQNELLKRLWS